MTSDEFEVDATPCKTVQRPVFRAAIDTPEPRAAEVCEPGAELKPQQSEQPKDEIAVGGRVRHDLLDFEARFVLEQAIENVERVADRPGDDDGVKPGELVAREVVVGDASAGSKVPRVRPGVEGSDRYDEAKPVGRPKGRATKLMLDDRRAEIVDYLNKGVSKRSVAKILGCSPTTLYSWIRRRRISGR